ncbi:MAG: hypothetical protein GY838_03390 [bacterium]|nr:hypothetical protein [bacterium]
MRLRFLSVLLVSLPVLVVAGGAVAQDLEELLVQVGEEYATGYTAPFLHGFGANQNANLYSTAHIPWNGLTFGVGVKVMGTHLNEDDQTFRKVIRNVDLGDFDPALAGITGDVVLSGPTIFGNADTPGRLQGYVGGMEVINQPTITGLLDTRFVPLVTPEFYAGGIAGFKAVVRWFPEMELGDYGKTSYMGYGLQWNANGVLQTLPVNVMVGFFSQKLEVGTLLESTGSSYHLVVSKDFPAFTAYGGYALESSEMDISYTEETSGTTIAFTTEGVQDNRLTLGVTLDILMKLNLEMGHGKLTTYSAGLMFGF